MNSPTSKPIRKIKMTGIASVTTAVIIVLAWLLKTFFPEFQIDDTVVGAIALLAMTFIPTLTGYQTKNDPGDFNHRVKAKKDGK